MIGAPMRAEFHREDEPDTIVGSARWTGGDVEIEAEDPKVRRGPVVLAPGSLRWFLACTQSRTAAEKLGIRLTPDPAPRMGWDPAGAYRRFADQVERAEELASTDEP
jgi:hypothetical protein